MSASIDFAPLMHPVALELLGEPTKTAGPILRYSKTGKIKIDTARGVFIDYSADAKGGVLDLIRHLIGLHARDAMRWLAERGLIPEQGDLGTEVRAAYAPSVSIPDHDTPDRDQTALDRAAWVWDHATAARASHPYLIAKGISPDLLPALPIREYKGALVLRLHDAAGNFIGLQFIGADGSKRYNRGISKQGAHALIGPDTGAGRLFVEGLATGATVHQATGKQAIIALDTGNLPQVFAQIGRPGDAIAADHDAAPKPGEHWDRAPDTFGAGHKAAMRAGALFYMPDIPGADFNDIGPERARAILTAPPISELPRFDAWKLPRRPEITTSADALKKLREAAGKSRPWARFEESADIAELAYTAAAILAHRAPAQRRLIDVRVEIERAAPGRLHPATLDHIIERLAASAAYREAAALAAVNARANQSVNTAIERPTTLPTIETWKGIIAVRAPMGAGKTQRIGRPMADYAAANGERFLAISPSRSLTKEMAKRLGLDHYNEIEHGAAEFAPGLATCLPSITRPDHAPLIENARFIFIDEISQVLRMLASASVCRTATATNEGVHHRLRQIVSAAECIVVADAHLDQRTLDFLEECRPGERIRLIDVPDQDQGIVARYRIGRAGIDDVVREALEELAAGGRVWLAAESKKKVKELGSLFDAAGYAPLVIHSENTGNDAQRAFLQDADRESRKYRIVISSPAISSGISIQHDDAPPNARFTLGCYIGAGYSTTPADAAQQLGRVRYLKRWSLALNYNNVPGDQHANAILDGRAAAADLEARDPAPPREPLAFDRFVAGIDAERSNTRSDFASGLLWILNAKRWHIQHVAADGDETIRDQSKAARAAADRRWRDMIIAAPRIDDQAAARIRDAAVRSELEAATLEAYDIRTKLGLGLLPISDAVLDVWSDGAIVAKLDRFNAFRGLAPAARDDAGEPLTSRRFRHALERAYRDLFDGIDILAPDAITPAIADTILDRLMARRDLYAALGIVSRRYSQYREDQHGRRLPMARPRYAIREVGDLLDRMALTMTKGRQRRAPQAVTDGALPVRESTPCVTPEPPAKAQRIRVYSVDAESIALVTEYAERRAVSETLEPISTQAEPTAVDPPPPPPLGYGERVSHARLPARL